MKNILFLLCSVLFLQLHAGSLYLKEDIIIERYDFENNEDIPNWEGNGHSLQLSGVRSKSGKSSMLWEISNKSPIILESEAISKAADFYVGGQPEKFEPSYIKKSRQGGIKLWVYRTQANPEGKLKFRVASSAQNLDNPKYEFAMKQNFTGWRAFWVHLEEDALIEDYSGNDRMNAMSIEPVNMNRDKVYLDLFQFVKFVSRKRHSDDQFVNNKDLEVRTDSYLIYEPWKMYQAVVGANRVRKDHLDSMDLIEDRIERMILGETQTKLMEFKQSDDFQKNYKKKVSFAEKLLKKLDIKNQSGVITGTPLFSSRDEQGAKEGETFQYVMEKILFPLALDYRLSPTNEKKETILGFLEYLADQGWAAGSSVGTTDHIIRLNSYACSVFLLREELKELGTLDDHQQTLAWHLRLGKMSQIDLKKGENTDHVRGGLLPKLICISLMSDAKLKVVWMDYLKAYLEYVIAYAPGYSDTIKPDFSLYHHRSAYQNSYGVQAVTVMSILNWIFGETAFEIKQESAQLLEDALMAQFEFSADFEQHPGIGGRFPYSNSGIDRFMLPAYAYLACSGYEVDNPEIAAIFARSYELADLNSTYGKLFTGLTYYGTYGTIELMEKLHQEYQGKTESLGADGYFVKPYAGFANYKNDGWSASVRGVSKYIWDFESGHKGENPFGRYMAFGSLFLMTKGEPKTLDACGVDLDGGFDWSFLPGATTKALPMEELYYKVQGHPVYLEGKHRNFTENTFLGGVEHEGNGIFAMEFHDTVPDDGGEAYFDPSFTFKKSYFFFGNQIIALGSGISNEDNKNKTVTTLFQSKIDRASQEINKNSKGGLFEDPQGNFYFVPNKYSVSFEQGLQKSLKVDRNNEKGYVGVEAHHKKAYIDHGSNPANKDYEYMILVQANENEAQELERNLPYQVLQKDDNAHVVKHLKTGMMAYSLFETGEVKHGPISATDTPVMAIVESSKKKISISIANPDLNLSKWNHNMSLMPADIVHAPAEEQIVQLSVHGIWNLQDTGSNTVGIKQLKDQNQTVLTYRTIHGQTQKIILSIESGAY